MYIVNICTIKNAKYSIRREYDISKYILFRDEKMIAAIIRIEYKNWKGHQIKFIPHFFTLKREELSEEDLIALEDSIKYLNEHFGT